MYSVKKLFPCWLARYLTVGYFSTLSLSIAAICRSRISLSLVGLLAKSCTLIDAHFSKEKRLRK